MVQRGANPLTDLLQTLENLPCPSCLHIGIEIKVDSLEHNIHLTCSDCKFGMVHNSSEKLLEFWNELVKALVHA